MCTIQSLKVESFCIIRITLKKYFRIESIILFKKNAGPGDIFFFDYCPH